MKYHAKLDYGDRSHYWWNHSKDRLVKSLVVPFVNGQVVLVNEGDNEKLLNMKNVTLLTVFKTGSPLKAADERSIIDQIREDDFLKNECTSEILDQIRIGESVPQSASLLQKALQIPKEQAFVIMKFGDEVLDSAYEGAYKPIVESYDLKCVRIDEIQDSGLITDQILETIAESKYIIADLTGERPNCYYECGFAHALGKELILCIKKADSIHFDLAGYRFIEWKTEFDLRKRLKQRLKSLERDEERSN